MQSGAAPGRTRRSRRPKTEARPNEISRRAHISARHGRMHIVTVHAAARCDRQIARYSYPADRGHQAINRRALYARARGSGVRTTEIARDAVDDCAAETRGCHGGWPADHRGARVPTAADWND